MILHTWDKETYVEKHCSLVAGAVLDGIEPLLGSNHVTALSLVEVFHQLLSLSLS